MFRAVGCNQMTFPATRSNAWIKLWIDVTDKIFPLTRPAVLLWEGRPDMREWRKSSLLHLPPDECTIQPNVDFSTFAARTVVLTRMAPSPSKWRDSHVLWFFIGRQPEPFLHQGLFVSSAFTSHRSWPSWSFSTLFSFAASTKGH